jgi:hypothetical protein
MSRDGALRWKIEPATSLTESLECTCRRYRKQTLPAHRSDEKPDDEEHLIGSAGSGEEEEERCMAGKASENPREWMKDICQC